MMRILIVSDDLTSAWSAQRRVTEGLGRALGRLGHLVELAGPGAANAVGGLAGLCDSFSPEAVHLASEGAAARAAADLCRSRGMPYSTAFSGSGEPDVRWHGASSKVLVPGPTASLRLWRRGLGRSVVWTPGVDAEEFHPTGSLAVDTSRPVTAWSGTLDQEHAVRRYLESPLGGTLFVVGEGRAKRALAREFPAARFVGALPSRALAALYSCLDAFVHTDEERESPVEVLEALACGTPVVCLPARGLARWTEGCPGVAIVDDLRHGVALASGTPREDCIGGAGLHPMSSSARSFAAALVRGAWCAPFDAAALTLSA